MRLMINKKHLFVFDESEFYFCFFGPAFRARACIRTVTYKDKLAFYTFQQKTFNIRF
jgi:hypothetical protein